MPFWHLYMGIEGGSPVTEDEAVYFAILEAVQDGIQALNLDGIDDADIQLVKVNPGRETVKPTIPGILVFPTGTEAIPLDGGTLRRDDLGYPVGILMLDADRQSSVTGIPADADEGHVDQDYNFNAKLLWREKIRKKFIRQRLTAVAITDVDVWTCEVEPDIVVDPGPLWSANLWVGSLVLRFISRETRGVS